MKIAEALDRVNSIYVPGTAKYYGALDPDPWQQAHDDLEAVMQKRDWRMTESACDRFVARCEDLINRFKAEGRAPKGVSIADAVFLGDEKRVKSWQSRTAKHCVKCEGKENLTLVPKSQDSMDVAIVCKGCLQEARRA